MMMNDSGQMLPLMTGPKKWLAWELSWRNMQTSPITRWWAFARHTFVSVVTISSPWWKSKRSCTIQPSRLRCRTHHSGHTPCTSRCHTVATAICKIAQLVRTPSGKWWWTNLTVVRTQPTTNTCPDALWSIRAQTFCLESNSTTSWTTTSIAITNKTELR